MTAQDQVNALTSADAFFSQWGKNIERTVTGLTTGGLPGLFTTTKEKFAEDAQAYLIVKNTAEESTFGKVGQVIADVKYNDTNVADAVKNAEFNGWDALTAAAELLPLDLLATGAKIGLGKTTDITTDDAVASAIDAIGLIPVAGTAAKLAKVPAALAEKTVFKEAWKSGKTIVDIEDITAKEVKIGKNISKISSLANVGNIGLTTAYFGNQMKQAFDEADQIVNAGTIQNQTEAEEIKTQTSNDQGNLQEVIQEIVNRQKQNSAAKKQTASKQDTEQAEVVTPIQQSAKTASSSETGLLNLLSTNAKTILAGAAIILCTILCIKVIDNRTRTAK